MSIVAEHEQMSQNKDFFKEVITGIDVSNSIYFADQKRTKVEDVLFEMFQDKTSGLVQMRTVFEALSKEGIQKTDQRLRNLITNLKNLQGHGLEELTPDSQRLDRSAFKEVINDDLVLISRALRGDLVIPKFQDFNTNIEKLYLECKKNNHGKNAAYIPQLEVADSNSWGISICTVDGQRFSIGDATVPFTIQSCSKPLSYGIVLESLGQEEVHTYVGQEPSGRIFNELVLDDVNSKRRKPHNPMINAGAIIVATLLKNLVKPDMTLSEKFDYTKNFYSRIAGGEYIQFNNAVYLSEREVADRNFALAYYMKEHGCFPKDTDLQRSLDFYFQCCSMEANCESMAVMAATLANGGVCPTTEDKVFTSDAVRNTLTLMHSCGMYDYSGQFAFKVGLPAKSGVSGALMLVIPNVMGICTWSPPLDQNGNSVRGVKFCEELVKIYNFHYYDNLKNSTNKLDPRKSVYETKGLSIVNMLFAAANGDLITLKRYRLSGMDMSLSDYDRRSALHLAAGEGHLDCVEYLVVEAEVSYLVTDRWGNTPISDAMKFGKPEVVNFLIKWAKEHPDKDSKPTDYIEKEKPEDNLGILNDQEQFEKTQEPNNLTKKLEDNQKIPEYPNKSKDMRALENPDKLNGFD